MLQTVQDRCDGWEHLLLIWLQISQENGQSKNRWSLLSKETVSVQFLSPQCVFHFSLLEYVSHIQVSQVVSILGLVSACPTHFLGFFIKGRARGPSLNRATPASSFVSASLLFVGVLFLRDLLGPYCVMVFLFSVYVLSMSLTSLLKGRLLGSSLNQGLFGESLPSSLPESTSAEAVSTAELLLSCTWKVHASPRPLHNYTTTKRASLHLLEIRIH